MRLYLDTNMLVFMATDKEEDNITEDNLANIYDYDTILPTSSVCMQELVHLIQIGKVKMRYPNDIRRSAAEAFSILEEKGVEMVSVTRKHIETLAELPIFDDHRDPNDRLRISQAISDRIPLISSDHKFTRYERYGLGFVFNER